MELSARGPFGAAVVALGRWAFGKRLVGGCQTPQEFKAKVASSSEVHVTWVPHLRWNLFHEEAYVLSWRQDGAEWQERPVPEEDTVQADKRGGKLKFLLRDLPEGAGLQLRLRSENAKGPSGWTPEVKACTLLRPSDESGGVGPLGPAAPGGEYAWWQTKSEVGVRIPLPASRRGRDIKVRPMPLKLDIRCGGDQEDEGEALLCGAMPKRARADEVLWDIEEEDERYGRHLTVTLTKADAMEKWPCLVEGHPKIDTSFVKFKGSGVAGLDIWE